MIVCDQQTDLLEISIRVDQPGNAFARGQFALFMLALGLVRAAALPKFFFERV